MSQVSTPTSRSAPWMRRHAPTAAVGVGLALTLVWVCALGWGALKALTWALVP